jgi:hypothetical protein
MKNIEPVTHIIQPQNFSSYQILLHEPNIQPVP